MNLKTLNALGSGQKYVIVHKGKESGMSSATRLQTAIVEANTETRTGMVTSTRSAPITTRDSLPLSIPLDIN